MTEPTIRVAVDATNPGQFFACCGLLELADRLWTGTEGWFDGHEFCLAGDGASLDSLLQALSAAAIKQLDIEDDCSSPLEIGAPFNLRLDWWADERCGGKPLKVWAGSMRSVRIARALQNALRACQTERLFDHGMVVYDPAEPDNKVEPYYFDSRRGANAQSLDIGFAPDALSMTTTAYPAVEFLCLVGLQRSRVKQATAKARVFDYFTWSAPLPVACLPAAVNGLLGNAKGYRFENGFRTDQKKHKAFLPAIPIGEAR